MGKCPHCGSRNMRRRYREHRRYKWRCRRCNRVFRRPKSRILPWLGVAVVVVAAAAFFTARQGIIELPTALSPQGKDPVERMAGTFQDRLISKLRLAGATTIPEASTVLANFLPRLNEGFRVPSQQPDVAYRSLDPDICLDRILCYKHWRKVARDNTVKYRWRNTFNCCTMWSPGPMPDRKCKCWRDWMERCGCSTSGASSRHTRWSFTVYVWTATELPSCRVQTVGHSLGSGHRKPMIMESRAVSRWDFPFRHPEAHPRLGEDIRWSWQRSFLAQCSFNHVYRIYPASTRLPPRSTPRFASSSLIRACSRAPSLAIWLRRIVCIRSSAVSASC